MVVPKVTKEDPKSAKPPILYTTFIYKHFLMIYTLNKHFGFIKDYHIRIFIVVMQTALISTPSI